MKLACTNCGFEEIIPDNRHSSWISATNYYGICGTFCPSCYNKVSHDSYGNPKRPQEYEEVLQKQLRDKLK